MFECHICGHGKARDERVSEVFTVDGRRVLVEHIPAQVCERCGEATFSSDTAEQIRELVHGHSQPVKTVPLEVFAMV
jgi:YgiT-type zinc finger domain-containing protein